MNELLTHSGKTNDMKSATTSGKPIKKAAKQIEKGVPAKS
jgi:hypothetical protein